MAEKKRAAGKQPVLTVKPKAAKPKKSALRNVLEVVVPAILIFFIVRAYLFETRVVPTPSMETTIMVGDRFLENKLLYHLRTPSRGEIIVFDPPTAVKEEARKYGQETGVWVKRLIGLPGEKVEIKKGKVYINDTLLPEPYLPAINREDYRDVGPFYVPKGYLFVMGDNRLNSYDSTKWPSNSHFLPIGNVEGKAFWRTWPFSRFGTLH